SNRSEVRILIGAVKRPTAANGRSTMCSLDLGQGPRNRSPLTAIQIGIQMVWDLERYDIRCSETAALRPAAKDSHHNSPRYDDPSKFGGQYIGMDPRSPPVCIAGLLKAASE